MMKKGFTLSELLMALTVVGVIIAIMAPMVVTHFRSKSQVAALQSAYTAIISGIKLIQVEEKAGSLKKTSLYYTDGSNITNTSGAFLKKYFNVSKDCETVPGDCFAPSYKNMAREDINMPENVYCVQLSTGASICLTPPGYKDLSARVYVDINGPARPNIAGRDYFLFYIYSDGFVGDRANYSDGVNSCRENEYGSGCFNRIVDADWVMDY